MLSHSLALTSRAESQEDAAPSQGALKRAVAVTVVGQPSKPRGLGARRTRLASPSQLDAAEQELSATSSAAPEQLALSSTATRAALSQLEALSQEPALVRLATCLGHISIGWANRRAAVRVLGQTASQSSLATTSSLEQELAAAQSSATTSSVLAQAEASAQSSTATSSAQAPATSVGRVLTTAVSALQPPPPKAVLRACTGQSVVV